MVRLLKELLFICIIVSPFRGLQGYCADVVDSANTEATSTETDKQQASEHFKKGRTLQLGNDCEHAAEEFERANELYLTKNGLYNLAICYLEMGRYVEAAENIVVLKERYGEQLDDKWHSDIFEFEKKIETLVVRVTLEVNVDGAQVAVDGKHVGVTPLRIPIILDVKDHDLVVGREGYEPQTYKISAQSGGTSSLNVTLYRVSQNEDNLAPLAPVGDEHLDSDARPKRVWTWVVYGIAGATGIGAIVTGTKSVSLSRDVLDNCTNNLCPSDQKADSDKSHSLGVAANVLIGLTATGIVVGTILFFTEGKTKKERVAVVPSVAPNGAGVTLVKTF